ncbi:hypothetical protein HPC62_00050 [Thermoleptolyngbya sichuanensis A183]|uniref:Uncharacterized protein n=1 Tax=Thermoleptolyngbya sichuanensis A183 TaxID=2737172 RepID=A0A6M8B187_9CYAN|nr:hypothetical protein [Thermoleptolyngbya sichuanensis]QKD80779.1 hypothetical protein HPC62_00050 [Thermoleptolyngbya sichuanensis A183]
MFWRGVMRRVDFPPFIYPGGAWILSVWIEGEYLSIRHFVFLGQAERVADWLEKLLPDLKIRIHYA